MNACLNVAVPPGVVTDTDFAPNFGLTGLRAVTTVGVTDRIVAVAEATVTLVAPWRLVPMIAKTVPPVRGPVPPTTCEIVGSAIAHAPKFDSNVAKS